MKKRNFKTSYFFLFCLLIVSLLLTSACGQPAPKPAEPAKPAEPPKPAGPTLTWTAGSMGGGWYTQAGGFAELFLKKNVGVNVKVIPGGGVQNALLVNKGECEIGWGLPPLVDAAIKGQDPYQEKAENIRGIATDLGISYFHFIVGANTPYKSIKEVLGENKKINLTVSVVGSSDEWVFRKVLEFYGTSYDKLKANGSKIFHAGYADQATQFKDKNVDVYFTFLGLPGAAVTEASIGREMRILPWPDDLLNYLAKFNVGTGEIPAGTYPKAVNGNENIKTATMSNCIIVNKNLSEDVVYNMTKAICEDLAATKAIHPAFSVFKPETAWKNIGAPLHPGAEKYYKEKGYIK